MHYQSTIQLLKNVRRSLSQGWCRDYYAVDSNGQPIPDIDSHKAAAWCIMGAFHQMRNGYGRPTREDAMFALTQTVRYY